MSRPVEIALTELAEHIDWPHHPDQMPEVRRRLAARPVTRPRRRWIPVTALLLVVVASLLLFSPRARQAVADLLGVAGIEIRFGPEPTEPIGGDLDLGEAVTLVEAAEAVDFDLSMPQNLSDPVGVFLSDRPPSGRISMVWEGSGALPAAGDSGIGLVYSQFEMELGADEDFIKSVTPDSSVRGVEMDGMLGLWIEGAPHLISYEDATGNQIEEETRLAGNVLMWESDGVTHRIETTLGLGPALALARSIQPGG